MQRSSLRTSQIGVLALLFLASGCVIDKMDANREPTEAGGGGGTTSSSGGAGGLAANAGAMNGATAGAMPTSSGGTNAAGAPWITTTAGSGGTSGGATSVPSGGVGVAGATNSSGASGGPGVGGISGGAGRSPTGGTTATGGVAAGGASAGGRSTGGNATGGTSVAGAATGGLTGVAGSSGMAGAVQLAGKVESLGNNITRVTYDFARTDQLGDWLVVNPVSTTLTLANGLLHVTYNGGGMAVAKFRLPLRSTRLAFRSTVVSTPEVDFHHVNAYLMTTWNGSWNPAAGYGLIHVAGIRLFTSNGVETTILSEVMNLQQAYQTEITVASSGFNWVFNGVATTAAVTDLYQGLDRSVFLGSYNSTVQFDDVILEGEFAVPVVGR